MSRPAAGGEAGGLASLCRPHSGGLLRWSGPEPERSDAAGLRLRSIRGKLTFEGARQFEGLTTRSALGSWPGPCRTGVFPMATTPCCSSDLTDDQWAIVRPHPPPVADGAPRTTDLRAVLDGPFSVASNGVKWEDLPKDYPPEGNVRAFFHRRRRAGPPDRVHAAFRTDVRAVAVDAPDPSAASIDLRSGKVAASPPFGVLGKWTTIRGYVHGGDRSRQAAARTLQEVDRLAGGRQPQAAHRHDFPARPDRRGVPVYWDRTSGSGRPWSRFKRCAR